jgi:hypothetical protein
MTFRVTDVDHNSIEITPEWTHEMLEDFPVPFRQGFLSHAYCNTPDSIKGKSFNCLFNYQGSSTESPVLTDQFRIAVEAASDECYTFTHDVSGLQNAVINTTRQRSDMRLQAERHAVDQASLRSLSLDNNFFPEFGRDYFERGR